MSTMIMNPLMTTPSYRLTRRGRLTVFLLSLTVVLGLALAYASGSVATSHPGTDTTKVRLVAPGETLWDVAAEATGSGDVRDMMVRIEHLNGLDSVDVQAGQRLQVPTQ